MTSDARQEVIDAELASAGDALRAAEALRGLGLINDALSRLYFAAMHLTRALLATRGVEGKSHRGLISLLGLHYIKPGVLEPEYQHILGRLETWRDKADYERGFVATADLVDTELGACRKLEARVRELIRAAGLVA